MADSIKEKIKEKSPGFVSWTHKVRGAGAHYLYGRPSRRMKVIGVTGTNGKTTTCHLIAKILEEAGARVGMATTTTFKVGGREWTNKTNMTSVSPFALQRLLSRMAKVGCQYAIIETTSHAVAQFRNWGIKYHALVLTNVTHDHLDYHESFNDYLGTKLKLFRNKPNISVINADDPSAEKFLAQPAGKHLSYSVEHHADVTARKILPDGSGTIFNLVLPSVQATIDFHLPGKFNVSNAVAASAVCYGLEIPIEAIKSGLEKTSAVPGRMERIDKGQDFTVIVDYAHTPDALEKAYSSLKEGVRGRMIAVLGACGDRDKTKRPIMGSIAGRFADIVVVTDEEPYHEDPQEIIEQVASGVPRGGKMMEEGENFFKVPDRREGIHKALSLAERNDLVIITGMGAQEFRVVGDKHLPWNDPKVVKEELAKLGFAK